MWQMLCNFGVFAAFPNLLRRLERRFKRTNGPEPLEWTMRQDRIASFARPDALEVDMWSRNRRSLEEDYWADRRRDIDGAQEGKFLWSDAARRKRIAEQKHDALRPGKTHSFFLLKD